MKIYIVERDNPFCKPEPEIFFDGTEAREVVEKEYKEKMKEFGTSQEKADAGYGSCGCYWNFDNENYCGDCLIDMDYNGERWEWRITEHILEKGGNDGRKIYSKAGREGNHGGWV